jgi:alanine racemase
MNSDNFASWLEVDLGILANNYRIIRNWTQTPVMPIVKANAYGHGLEEVTRTLEKVGAEWCGVARIEEALILRESGLRMNILVLGYTAPQRVQDAIRSNISLTLYDPLLVQPYAQQAKVAGHLLNIQVKIDTGMGRLGIPAEKALEFIQKVDGTSDFHLQGVFTHFACADEPLKPYTQNQLDKFVQVINSMHSSGIRTDMIHSANSAAAINYPSTRFDIIRCGIALYGLPPSKDTKLPKGIKPAMSWKTRITSVKQLPEGHGISYGFKYFTGRPERIGVIAAGYGDGLRRQDGNIALLHGKRVTVIGNVCMDQCMVQLDHVPEAKVGDEVVLFGKQGDDEISATEIAENWKTINYEVICGMAARMPRHYIN